MSYIDVPKEELENANIERLEQILFNELASVLMPSTDKYIEIHKDNVKKVVIELSKRYDIE